VDNLLLFTAKWNEVGDTHPLVYHMIDSGQVAAALWSEGITEGSRREISNWLNLNQADAGKLIAFWTSLHDIGKAAPSFQSRCEPAALALKRVGLIFPPLSQTAVRHHSLLSAWILEQHLDKIGLAPASAASNLLLAIAGHHGIFPSFSQFNERTYRRENLGDEQWGQYQDRLLDLMVEIFNPPTGAMLKRGKPISNAFFDIWTGLVITADWISSNTDLFTYHAPELSPQDYANFAREQAEKALRTTGWLGWQPAGDQYSFKELFPTTPEPNPIQQAVFAQLESLRDPFLLILEAPTGSGKTEAALYTADTWIQQNFLRGFYIAMPTQSTSDQMFDRVRDYLSHRYPDKLINFHLAHGNAELKTEYQNMRLSGIADDEGDATTGVNALSWFSPRKLTLLAPFGVGTVDQTFLSVLQARHFALRLFGLSRKVIVFDEVHAYDVYMVEIFKRLLAWLRAIGSSVIILTATLPQQTRAELLTAFDPQSEIESIRAPFPRLSLNSAQKIRTINLGETESHPVRLEFIDQLPESVPSILTEKLKDGGCAGIICNTVSRAQKVYQLILDSGHFDTKDVMLFHSHFPFCWRESCQNEVLVAFGRLKAQAMGCRKKIVVATQVIEQSLDLDFDLLVSDLAPLDLLIQRIGRLQRHSNMQYSPIRPATLKQPTCIVAMPEEEEGKLAKLDTDRFVYEPIFLQRSYYTLRQKSFLSLPNDSDELIEAVYSDKNLPDLAPSQQEELHALYQEMYKKATDKSLKAQNHLVADVDFEDALGSDQIDYAEDDPTAHHDLQAATRDTRPNAQLVCLVRDEDGALHTLDDHAPIDLNKIPAGDLLKKALRSVVTISDWQVVQYFKHQPLHAVWKKSAHLRYLYPAIFESNVCLLKGGPTLHLDEKLGLIVEKSVSSST